MFFQSRILAIQGQAELAQYHPIEARRLYEESLKLHQTQDVKNLMQECTSALNEIENEQQVMMVQQQILQQQILQQQRAQFRLPFLFHDDYDEYFMQ